jgi:hypothetical protein
MVYSQYLPTLEENKTWAVSGYDIAYFEWRYMAEIYIDGVEVYEGQEYKVLQLDSEVAWQKPFGLIREDTVSGKVWFRSHLHADFNEYIATSDEVLLADYSLEPGDQFYYSYVLGYWNDAFFIDSLLYEVQEVGTISGRKYIETNSLTVLDDYQNGLWGDPFYISSLQYPAANQVPLRFIEGIGSSFSLISQSLLTLMDAAYPFDPYLLCAHIDDEEIWNDPFVEECFYEGELPLITSVDENEDENRFIVFPNPATDMMQINLRIDHTADIQLFDMAGKLWLTKSAITSEIKIQVDQLPQGVYLLLVQSDQYADSKLILKM